ncbi:MAG: hypothetical protein H0V18_13270, partial [Pyrinomonadaceae bacterium]|nr:hypothetical protein [Pyrinomonadaceae bacterium]
RAVGPDDVALVLDYDALRARLRVATLAVMSTDGGGHGDEQHQGHGQHESSDPNGPPS